MPQVQTDRISYALRQAYLHLRNTPAALAVVDEGGVTLERLLAEARSDADQLPPTIDIEHDEIV